MVMDTRVNLWSLAGTNGVGAVAFWHPTHSGEIAGPIGLIFLQWFKFDRVDIISGLNRGLIDFRDLGARYLLFIRDPFGQVRVSFDYFLVLVTTSSADLSLVFSRIFVLVVGSRQGFSD